MKKTFTKYPKSPSFKKTGIDQPITKFASPLISNHGEIWDIFGTGVMIAPGFALTAKHVIVAAVKKYENIDLDIASTENRELHGTHNTYMVQLIDGKKGYLWSVRQYFLSPFTDVCFLRLDPMFSIKNLPTTNKISINLNPPKIGERIVAFGYPNSSADADGNKIFINIDPKTTIGEVLEVFPRFRDRMLPFPVFRTNARFDPGMSGGPVFTDSGTLCGLICSNMPPEDPNLAHISYVTLLWPSMGTKVWMKLKNHDISDRFPVLFLAKHKYISAEGWESVIIPSDNQVAWKEEIDQLTDDKQAPSTLK